MSARPVTPVMLNRKELETLITVAEDARETGLGEWEDRYLISSTQKLERALVRISKSSVSKEPKLCACGAYIEAHAGETPAQVNLRHNMMEQHYEWMRSMGQHPGLEVRNGQS